MKKLWGIVSLLLFAAATVYAAPSVSAKSPDFPRTLINARFVYVTSYDGDQFRPEILDQDRQAIANVQDALQKWGHFTIVYKPSEADMVIAVQSRGSEDVLAVYDPAIPGTYLWRVMGVQGLQKGETPFVTELRKAYQRASK
ncbi:MAG TPA: hypothetical protein VFA68_01930 [Terriglobales bacterium]|nr:hypothetical protein [Terriglobales bacterium]